MSIAVYRGVAMGVCGEQMSWARSAEIAKNKLPPYENEENS